MKRVDLIVAARPNFMKIAPVWRALKDMDQYEIRIVHTGQHYDYRMSQQFFEEMELPEPTVNLGAGSGTHANQTAAVMVAYDAYLDAYRPDLIVVPGDVNSTLACALTAVKRTIAVAHLEAGLRSHDKTMPEEVNRQLTDALASIHWTPSDDANVNLLNEGVDASSISLVGNCMIDSLVRLKPKIDAREAWLPLGCSREGYVLVTLHRPGNTDDPERLASIFQALEGLAEYMPLLVPLHPRTRGRLKRQGLFERLEIHSGIQLAEPLGYVDFMSLTQGAKLVVTDSGGVQEETTYLGVPCITVRPNTERPVTCALGTNSLVEPDSLLEAATAALSANKPSIGEIPYWDGKAGKRVAQDLAERYSSKDTLHG